MARESRGIRDSRGRPRRRRQGGATGRVILLLCAAAALVAVFSLYLNQESQMERIDRRAAELEAIRADAEERNRKASETLAGIDTDEYIEEVAREQLGMVKPGERIFTTVQ